MLSSRSRTGSASALKPRANSAASPGSSGAASTEAQHGPVSCPAVDVVGVVDAVDVGMAISH